MEAAVSIHDYSNVVGVVDLKNNQAVAASGGQRQQYRPLESVAGSAIDLIAHYVQLGVAGIYIADLDAIQSGVINDRLWETLKTACADIPLYADIGRANLPTTVSDRFVRILSSESFVDVDQALAKMKAESGRVAIGLDYRGDRFLGECEEAWFQTAIKGSSPIVLLDLHSVGMNTGPSVVHRCQSIFRAGFRGRLISGGGVRDQRDVDRLRAAGCGWVLVGTAMHPKTN